MPLPAAPVVPVAAPLAAKWAAQAAHAAHAAARAAAPYAGDYGAVAASAAASGVLAAALARAAWRRLPEWARDDPAFRSCARPGLAGVLVEAREEKGKKEGDEEEMASLTSAMRKMQSWLESGGAKLGRSRLTVAQRRAAALAYVQLAAQLCVLRPEMRDRLFREEGGGPAPTEEVRMLRDVLDFAVWAYMDHYGIEAVKSKLKLRGYEMIDYHLSRVPGRVGYYLAVGHEKKTVLIGVKGTSSIEDVITDAAGKATMWEATADNDGHDMSMEVSPNHEQVQISMTGESGGLDCIEVTCGENIFEASDGTKVHCHEGILLSSLRLCDQVQPQVEKFAVRRDYNVLICGHSLGGAAAALLAFVLRTRLPSLSRRNAVHALAYGPPPVIDADGASSCSSYVTSVVNNSDCIPRCSVANLAVFLELLAVVSDRLEQKGMGLDGPCRISALIQQLRGGVAAVDSGGVEPIMTWEEVREAVDRSHLEVEVRDPDHLYVPGRVVLLFEPWTVAAARRLSQGIGGNSGVTPTPSKEETELSLVSWDSMTEDEFVNVAPVTGVVHSAISLGTARPLRMLEVGDGLRAATDHLTASYQASLDALLRLREKRCATRDQVSRKNSL